MNTDGTYIINRLMVGLDLTATDFALIRYTEFLCQVIDPHLICFVHTYEKPDLPQDVLDEIYGEGNPLSDIYKKQMEERVKKHFPSLEKHEVVFEVAEGTPLVELTRLTREKEADLLIVGRKPKTESSGVLLARLTRRSYCSVMIIPETAETMIDSILVCTDFSECSKFALSKAINLARRVKYANLYCHHIYEVPVGYHASGKSYQEFAQIMKRNAMKNYQALVAGTENSDIDLTPIITLDKGGKAAGIIHHTAKSIGAKMIVVGSKGRTFAASIFLGSFAEKLIRYEAEVPLFIVKRKNETLNVLEAIRSL